MAHFNFVISQNAKWGHAGFYIDCHRMTVPENILLQKSTGWTQPSSVLKRLNQRTCRLGVWTRLGARNHILGGGPDPQERRNLGEAFSGRL